MKVQLAVPLPIGAPPGARDHEPDDVIEVPADEARQLIADGWARVPDEVTGPADGEPGGPPARTGKGSSRDAWAAYAMSHGVPVGDETSRDEIVTALETAGVPVE